jgi:hypothetical protein
MFQPCLVDEPEVRETGDRQGNLVDIMNTATDPPPSMAAVKGNSTRIASGPRGRTQAGGTDSFYT